MGLPAAIIPAVLSGIIDVIGKVIPDPQAAAEAKLRALEIAQRGDLATLDAEMRLALGQMEINKVEAAADGFRGGWRPSAGWVCVAGMAYTYLLRPLLPWTANLFGFHTEPLPAIEIEELLVLLGGLLGLGGYRAFERVKGKA